MLIQLRGGQRLVFQKKLIKIKPWQLESSNSNLIRSSSAKIVHIKTDPCQPVGNNDFEEVSIDGSEATIPKSSSTAKVLNDVVVYMCSTCNKYFPSKRTLEEHKLKAHVNTDKDHQSTEGERVFYTGYHKVKSGQYVCNYCYFRSSLRTSVASHTLREHATLIKNSTVSQVFQGKAEVDHNIAENNEDFEDDDEASWPMEVVEESVVNKIDIEEETPLSRTRICPYCSFSTTNNSTFHSHVKRKHREDWLQSADKKATDRLVLESVKILDAQEFNCHLCYFSTSKSTVLRTHMLNKHESLDSEQNSDIHFKVDEGEIKDGQQYLNEITELEIEEIQEVEEFDSSKNTYVLINEVEVDDEITGMTEADTEPDSSRKSKKCMFCPFESWVNSTMQSHISRCHRNENLSSNEIPMNLPTTSFPGKRKLPNAQLYTGYACNYCTFVAATVASINSHTARQHQGQKQPIKEVPVNEYDCDQCDYKSRNRRNMQLHVKRCHTTEANADGMFACHACSYETLSRMGLKRHISIKHNKPRRDGGNKGNYHQCDQCEFKCLNGKTMDWHKRRHDAPANADDNGNGYFCNDCDFSTWTKGQLYLHIKRKHRDSEGNSKEPDAEHVDVFACEQCDYTTKNKHVMKVHVIRKHTNDYNHECEICGKKYKIKADLTNHIRFQHREQPIICDVCGKTCRNSNLLYLHQKFAHYKPEFECPICHRRMVSQANLDDHILKQHERKEEAVCHECGKKFTKQARLKIHMRIHTGVKPYTCKVCHKAFARRNGLRQHLLIHTGQRPYICDICGKSFTQKTGLICHRKSHPGSHPPLPRVTIDHVLSDLLNEEC